MNLDTKTYRMVLRSSPVSRAPHKANLRAARLAAVLLAVAAGAAAWPVPDNVRVAGTVRDASGAAVAGAQVTLTSGSLRARTETDGQGDFSFDLANSATGSGTVTVQAPGFASATERWSAQEPEIGRLQFTLRPASVPERVTVTATRTATRLDQTAADVSVLTSQDLTSTSALMLDDKLRQIPGFSLFRRSGSLAANPTSQGVSLRGVGASGASRGLVLEDAIPLNDPFGGWVYWDRVPRAATSSVEVVEGGSSDLYGSDAMGGVIAVRTRPIDFSQFSLEASYGNENTPEISLFSSITLGKWAVGVSSEALHTDGYILVPASIRGPIDSRAGVDYRADDLTLERRLSDRASVFARGNYLGEQRQNGKVNEENHTTIRQVAVGSDWQSASAGSFTLRAYGGTEGFDQNFYAVGPNRQSETLTDDQRVPVQDIGFSSQWSRTLGGPQTLVAGFEADGVRGSTNEFKFQGGSPEPTSAVGAGGRQRTFAFFGEDVARLGSKTVITLGARLDHWLNYDALSATEPLANPGPEVVSVFPNRAEQALSPRLSVLRRVSDNWSLTGSIYRAFRAPTLNELYRSFRLSNVLTLANNELQAERLTGVETGVTWASSDRRTTARGVFFWSDITRPIENVTLSTTSSLVTRERENLGRTRSRGVSLDLSRTLTRGLGFTAGYIFTNATVVSFPAEVALVGLRVPEVPRHEATFQVHFSNPGSFNRFARFDVGVQGRAESAAYDDDQNTLRLGPYFTIDAIVSRPLGHGADVFAAGENLTNQRYQVALTPAPNLGPPILFRLGFRLNLGGR